MGAKPGRSKNAARCRALVLPNVRCRTRVAAKGLCATHLAQWAAQALANRKQEAVNPHRRLANAEVRAGVFARKQKGSRRVALQRAG